MGEPASERSPEPSPGSSLDERARRILEFEATADANPAAKAEAIRAAFDLSSARYHRILAELIDSPAALRHDPMLVKRLQRMRDARAEARARRRILSVGRLD
ncbi:DUF3263 domain-containing protein [Agromyces protaetiae]|uniref:DUF3263 domain-containing protein n=1 Tax=Agromyces protaetiae TaxID=2509455 RepID=A0A4P6FRZ8_9MICO|nr:DUF3263 domain-containing protein [Agromyces protaetiae]QAY73308.1 DUF3263 domain-containing protein [Agromyces protaetiae]